MIVCVAGNPAIDKLFEVGTLAPGEIHRPDDFVPLPGGKGIHVAQVATALGADAIATGILGGHHGRWLAETLAHEGVKGVFAWAPGETRSCLTVADRATGGLTEFYEDGIEASTEDWEALAAIVTELLGHGARWLAMSGSAAAANTAATATATTTASTTATAADLPGYPALIHAARNAGVRSAVDSRGPDLARAIAAGPDLVKINAAEAAELLGVPPVLDIAGAHAAAQTIRGRAGGPGHAAVVTLGERGMVLVSPDGVAWHGTVAARGDYPVGSGDAFLAGLLTGLTDPGPGAPDPAAPDNWLTAAALALGAAASNAEVAGAARLDPARARELADAAQLTPLP